MMDAHLQSEKKIEWVHFLSSRVFLCKKNREKQKTLCSLIPNLQIYQRPKQQTNQRYILIIIHWFTK